MSEILFELLPTSDQRALGCITLNRPSQLNAINQPMLDQLKSHLERCAHDANILAVILTSSSQNFCAGGDVKALLQAGNVDFLAQEYHLDFGLHAYPKPLIALLDGVVMGGGLGLAAGAHLRIATKASVYAMPETRIGFIPDVGYRAQLIQMQQGFGHLLALTGAQISSELALELGMITHRTSLESADLLKTLGQWCQQWQPEPGPILPQLEAFTHSISEPTDSVIAKLAEPLKYWCQHALRGERYMFNGFWELYEHCDQTHVSLTQAQLLSISPLSLALTYELMQLAKTSTLWEIFEQDFYCAKELYAHGDLQEGIAAKLIDKRSPRWRYTGAMLNPGTVKSFMSPIPPTMLWNNYSKQLVSWLTPLPNTVSAAPLEPFSK